MSDEQALLNVYAVNGYRCAYCAGPAAICIGAGIEGKTYQSVMVCESHAQYVRNRLTRLLSLAQRIRDEMMVNAEA